MTLQSALILSCAVVTLSLGLVIYFRNVAARTDRFNATNVVAWLLMALFPVMVLFLFFPDNTTANGTIFGITLGGAVAAFFVIWYYGTRASATATTVDQLQAQIRDLQRQGRGVAASQPQERVLVAQTRLPRFRVGSTRRYVAVFGNDISNMKSADVWVNSENTNLQMARFYDRSVSGTIRYLGARKDQFGSVVDDTIAAELAAVVGSRTSVMPSTVCVTSAGELAKTHNVKRIFHVASVFGEVSSGYHPVSNIGQCVTSCLQKADSAELQDVDISSMLFPLLGAGTRQVALDQLVGELLNAALGYLESTPRSRIETVYFMARTEDEWNACLAVLEKTDRASRVADSSSGRLARAGA